MLRRHASEDLFGVQVRSMQRGPWPVARGPCSHPKDAVAAWQLCGSNVKVMASCAELLSEHANVDFIDINVREEGALVPVQPDGAGRRG